MSVLLILVLVGASMPGVAPASSTSSPADTLLALTPQEVAGLRQGAGMGFARVAELSSFPGPRHVLDLAEELGLDSDQRRRTQDVFDAMAEQAGYLGAEIIARERELEQLFGSSHPDRDAVRDMSEEIGRLRGRLRYVHLVAHLQMPDILTPAQVAEYDRLRGYAASFEAPRTRHE